MRVTPMPDSKEQIDIIRELMKVDTRTQIMDMQSIDNRRFMFDPKSGVLILGRQYGNTKNLQGSHAEDLAKAGVADDYDGFVRGWVGTDKDYPHGVIHLAPHIDLKAIALFNRAFDTLEMFSANGARDKTVVRGFGSAWEQPLSAILYPEREPEQKPSVRAKLKAERPQTKAKPEASIQQER